MTGLVFGSGGGFVCKFGAAVKCRFSKGRIYNENEKPRCGLSVEMVRARFSKGEYTMKTKNLFGGGLICKITLCAHKRTTRRNPSMAEMPILPAMLRQCPAGD